MLPYSSSSIFGLRFYSLITAVLPSNVTSHHWSFLIAIQSLVLLPSFILQSFLRMIAVRITMRMHDCLTLSPSRSQPPPVIPDNTDLESSQTVSIHRDFSPSFHIRCPLASRYQKLKLANEELSLVIRCAHKQPVIESGNPGNRFLESTKGDETGNRGKRLTSWLGKDHEIYVIRPTGSGSPQLDSTYCRMPCFSRSWGRSVVPCKGDNPSLFQITLFCQSAAALFCPAEIERTRKTKANTSATQSQSKNVVNFTRRQKIHIGLNHTHKKKKDKNK